MSFALDLADLLRPKKEVLYSILEQDYNGNWFEPSAVYASNGSINANHFTDKYQADIYRKTHSDRTRHATKLLQITIARTVEDITDKP